MDWTPGSSWSDLGFLAGDGGWTTPAASQVRPAPPPPPARFYRPRGGPAANSSWSWSSRAPPLPAPGPSGRGLHSLHFLWAEAGDAGPAGSWHSGQRAAAGGESGAGLWPHCRHPEELRTWAKDRMAALDLRAGAVATDINAAVNPDRRAASVGRSPRLAALGAGNLTLRTSGRAGEGRTGLAGEEAWLGWTQRCGGPGPRGLGLETLCTQPGRAGRTLPHGCHHAVPPAAWSTRAQGARRCAPPPTPVYTTALQPEAQGGWRPDTQPPSPTPCRRAERWPALAGRRPRPGSQHPGWRQLGSPVQEGREAQGRQRDAPGGQRPAASVLPQASPQRTSGEGYRPAAAAQGQAPGRPRGKA